MRVGELTAISRNNFGHGLSIGDISLTLETMKVILRFSKTDQRGKSSTLHFSSGPDATLCPVIAMQRFLDMRPKVQGPLFIHYGGDPLSRYQFGRVLTRGISTVGLSPANFSSHSFRIGAATSAAMSGIPIDTIKKLGRWQSYAVNLYIRPHHIL